MTRRHDIERRRTSLGEIRGIMNSMKTLAYLETRKLGRRTGPQQAVTLHINATADELLNAHPSLLPGAGGGERICIVIGSERGFCGDFNRALVELATAHPSRDAATEHWVLVGRRLHSLWPERITAAGLLDGASVTEELGAVLDAVVAAVSALRNRIGPGPLQVLSHPAEAGGPLWTPLLPPFRRVAAPARTQVPPPLLQLSARQMLLDLTDQYLFAELNTCLVHSLMAENHERVVHLERATRHLETQWDDLGRLSNALRQEEIIEEIEVLLLSAGQPRENAWSAAQQDTTGEQP